ncbi:MAG TPA: PQQ-binding-like beta-propeller repeat protein [Candidatus Polarisedimenticolia bacterium]|nr:PQQ-binding-like beta-propeller repeat protein [Candidatus Polarisedimenticolia bacterium]
MSQSHHRLPARIPVLLILALLAALPVGQPARADDWPQWRGPNRDARSAESGLLGSWPEGGPKKLWSASGFGVGYSSLAVAGGRIYTLGDLDAGQYLIAARQSDGGVLWKTKVGPALAHDFPGPRSTPTVAGNRACALGTEGDLVCVRSDDGKEIWRRNILTDFAGRQMKYGGQHYWRISESPLVDEGRVIVTPGAADALLVALDADTGKEVWRTKGAGSLGEKGDDGTAYSSAIVSNAGGVRQYVQLVGRGAVGVEAATGRLLWSYNRIANRTANIPTPIVKNDLVFVSTAYETGAALLKLAPGGGGITATERYFLPHDVFQNHHGNMILEDGVIYAGHGHNRGYPIAVEMQTGKVLWGPARNDGTGSAAVAWADGRMYMRYQNGLMVLVETTPEAYRQRGSFMIPDVRRESWSHPVIADGVLLLREQDRIHAYALKSP